MKNIVGAIFLVAGLACLPQVFTSSFPETIGGLIDASLVTFLPVFFLQQKRKNNSNNTK